LGCPPCTGRGPRGPVLSRARPPAPAGAPLDGPPLGVPRAGRGRLRARRIIEAIRLGSLPALLWSGRARPRGGARGRAAAARERRADAGSALGPGGPAAAHVVEAARAQHGGCSSLRYLCAAARPLCIAGGSGARARSVARDPRADAGAARWPLTRGRGGPSTRAAPVPVAVVQRFAPPRAGGVRRVAPCVSSLAREPAGGARVGRWAAAQRQASGAGALRCGEGGRSALCVVWGRLRTHSTQHARHGHDTSARFRRTAPTAR
jgi:hypothetical protein